MLYRDHVSIFVPNGDHHVDFFLQITEMWNIGVFVSLSTVPHPHLVVTTQRTRCLFGGLIVATSGGGGDNDAVLGAVRIGVVEELLVRLGGLWNEIATYIKFDRRI